MECLHGHDKVVTACTLQQQQADTGTMLVKQEQQRNAIAADDEMLDSVLSGNLSRLPALGSRTVCVFLSSTFSDMSPERNALMEHVYPQLKEFCRQQYQLEFRMMDLRWGIREQSHDDHTIIEFCLREIDKCREKSVGPNFVALIGQKYGYRPFPPTVCASEFEAIRDTYIVSDDSHQGSRELRLLDDWFKKNTNVLPHVYILQPISSHLPDYTNHQVDMTRKQKANEDWEQINDRLRQILRHGVTRCVQRGVLPANCKDKYFASVTEYEIERGMLSVPNGDPRNDETTLCFMRNITNLEDNIVNTMSRQYLDLIPNTIEIDRDAQDRLSVLRDKVWNCLTDERNLEYLELEWTTNSGRNPSDDSNYLKKFCESFRDKMQWLISRAAAARRPVSAAGFSNCSASAQAISDQFNEPTSSATLGFLRLDQRTVEVVQHLTMCRERSAEFRGRENLLRQLRLYFQPHLERESLCLDHDADCGADIGEILTNRPLVVYGESGSGKTAVMAKVASLTKKWFLDEGADPVVITRFLGTTSHSCNIRLLLSSVCWQIRGAYKMAESSDLLTDYPDLVAYFKNLLMCVATRSRPLVMVFDGLDQLGTAHRAYNLAWLPIVLPPNVRMVVSVLKQTTHEVFETLQALLPLSAPNFVLIPSLGSLLSVNIVQERLLILDRTLTPDQMQVVEKALCSCSLPLYTSLVFEEVCRWASFDVDARLESTVNDIINTFFGRLELYHGKVFVSHTLSYLTASRDGLSDAELEDVLSIDDTVLNDVFQHWLPPLRRIPPLLIPRLLDELGRYVVRREAHGVDVIYWYHGQFISVARRRYLLVSEDHRRLIHTMLAQYYLGTWAAGSKKPFRYSTKQLRCQSGGRGGGRPRRMEDAADRMVAQQPLFFGADRSAMPGIGACTNYNLRKLYEMPFHLVESRMYKELRQHVLFNYEWLHSKLSATSLPDVLADFQMTLNSANNMDATAKAVITEDVQLLAGALRVGGSHLSSNSDTLAFDLLGRLLHRYNDSDFVTHTHREDEDDDDDDDNNNGKDDVIEKRTRGAAGIKSLLQECDQLSPHHSALVPILRCFDPPTTMSLFVLEGHSQMVSDVAFSPSTNELLSISKDGTLVFWDLESGERSRWIDVSDKRPGRCTRLNVTDSNHVVVDYDRVESLAFVYDVKTGRELHECGRPRQPSPLRRFVTGNILCRQKSLVDIESGEELFLLDDFIESKSYALCIVTPDTNYLLVGEYFGTRLFPLKQLDTPCRPEWIAYFPAENQPTAMAVSADTRHVFVGHALSCELIVGDIDELSGTFGEILLKFSYRDYVDPIIITNEVSSGESKTEQRFPNEISEISTDCSSRNVLLNVCRYQLVVLRFNYSVTEVDDCFQLELPYANSKEDIVLTCSCFNYDGRLVLACGETYLFVWNTESGRLVNRIVLHTTAGYPLAVHPTRNLVATGSTVRTSVMVWDLDKTQNTDVTELKVYNGPVDCIAVAQDARLIFVKNHHSLSSSNRNFLHFWWFGVDVWNLSTGTCQPILPFNNYGRLMQMTASPEGERLALLLVNVSHSSHVIVFSIGSNGGNVGNCSSGLRRKSVKQEVLCVAKHEHCSSFLMSSRWNYMVTVSMENQGPSRNEIRLWDLHSSKANNAVVVFREATSPTFSLNSTYLLYIDCGRTIIAYSLNAMAPKYRVPDCSAQRLIASPVNNYVVMATLLPKEHVTEKAIVTICDFKTRSVHRVLQVAPSGLVDVSADGKLAVDGLVQVFDLQTGLKQASFEHQQTELPTAGEKAQKLIRLTGDGKFVVWIEPFQVRVGRVSNSTLLACTSTHERPTSLEMLDFGYVLVIGREDGRLLTMKLVTDQHHRHKYNNVLERTNHILNRMDHDPSLLKSHQRRPTSTPDRAMPIAGEPVISALLRLADVPVSVIDTSHRPDNNQLRDYRRSLDVTLRTSSAGHNKSGNSFPAVDNHALYYGVTLLRQRADLTGGGCSATPSPNGSRWELSGPGLRSTTIAGSSSTRSIGDLLLNNGMLTSYKRLSRSSTKRCRSAQDLYRLDRSSSKLDMFAGSTVDIRSTVSGLAATKCGDQMGKHGSRHSVGRLSSARDRLRNLFRRSSEKLMRTKHEGFPTISSNPISPYQQDVLS